MRRRGLSLLELIVSLSLVLLVVTFVLNLFPGSLISLRRSESRRGAESLVQNELESALSLPFDSFAVGSTVNLPDRQLNGRSYKLQRMVMSAGGPPAQIVTLQVEARWDEGGQTRHYSQQMIRCRAN